VSRDSLTYDICHAKRSSTNKRSISKAHGSRLQVTGVTQPTTGRWMMCGALQWRFGRPRRSENPPGVPGRGLPPTGRPQVG